MRRTPRRTVSVGRSIGVAEHHRHTVLTRPIATRVLALACLGALVFLPTAAHAQSASEELAATRRAIDGVAQRWFAAQNNAAAIDAHINELSRQITNAQARVADAQKLARARALVMYEGASLQYASVIGTSAIDSARRAELMDRADERNRVAIDSLNASVDALEHEQHSFIKERARQAEALKEVGIERDALDARLASLRDAVARSSRIANTVSHRRLTVAARDAAPTRPADAGPAIIPGPPPRSNQGVNPHHDDPFLVCTRARESNGNYGAVSPSGYYGAYQFLPSTWDATAVHAGRNELIGVLPSHASEFDQDEMAWTLYQWQGKAPWGGRC